MASRSSPFAWAAATDESLVRRLDLTETFFKLLSDSGATVNREHWATSLAVTLDFPKSIAKPSLYLQRAWLVVCHVHPALVGSASRDTSYGQSTFTAKLLNGDEDEATWPADTFFINHTENCSGYIVSASNPDDLLSKLRATASATCHWLPESQQIHIRDLHWRIDGVGMMLLGHSYMTALCAVLSLGLDAQLNSCMAANGVASSGLTQCLDVESDAFLDEATTPTSLRSTTDEFVNDFVQGIPSIVFPMIPGSEATVLECGVHVAAAVEAALVCVAATYPQHPLAKSYASFFPVDLRRQLVKSPEKAGFVVKIFCSSLPVRVSGLLDVLDGEITQRGKGFDDVAEEIGSVYRSLLVREPPDGYLDNQTTLLKLVWPLLRRTRQLFSMPPPPELPPAQSLDISSLGKVDVYLKTEYTFGAGTEDKVRVSGFWLGTHILLRNVQCHVWIFKDYLKISACFNGSFYDEGLIAEILSKTREELLSGLGIA
ncbi:hypothetical protein QQS21_004785 [Conoideocrella luteorostrata]|uniref:Uncharacterized protein n=1 Tax=Conoideocrella luteorostrata TaxID=1105319 RepID=A0AAJ0FZL1_9HYPO|nr:hypothetical protein QQS21_004785 [Conoideocrella luteorostrata]